jgi:MFS-type transporter involved in bile tolerance (Atg22 family)
MLGAVFGFLVMGFSLFGLIGIFEITQTAPLTLVNSARTIILPFRFDMTALYWIIIALPLTLCVIRMVMFYILKLVHLNKRLEIAEEM